MFIFKMTTYLRDQVEKKYKEELDDARKQVKDLEDKLDIAQTNLNKIQCKIDTEIKVLEKNEFEKVNDKIKFKGPSDKNEGLNEVLDYFENIKKRFYYLSDDKSFYSLIKKEYPSFDIDNDIVECKKEIFNGHTHFTFFINGYAFYQIHSAIHECWDYYVDEIDSGIKKYISFKELESKRISREKRQSRLKR